MPTNNIHVNIYKFYFLCLPLGHVFNFPFNDAIQPYLPDFSTLVALFGLLVLATSEKSLSINKRIRALYRLYAILAVYSILASMVLTLHLNNPIESSFRAIVGDIVLYLLFILSVYYNYVVLNKYIKITSLFNLLKLQMMLLLFVGFIQYLSINGVFSASILYNTLASIFSLRELSWLSNLERGVTFFGTEPASASLICYLTIPYILAMIITKKGKQRFTFFIILLLFAFLFFSSDSSSALISFIFVLLATFYLGVMKGRPNRLKLISFTMGLLMAIMYTVVFAQVSLEVDNDAGFSYVLLGKFFDTTNYSTITRTSTIINDMNIFKDFPITGVGNGNQGFYYNTYVPYWMDSSKEVQDLRNVIPNGGGNFFPSFLSGFGIIGICLLYNYVKKFLKWESDSVLAENSAIAFLYNISISLFLLSSWYSVSMKSFEIMAFLLCLPLIKSRNSIDLKLNTV